MRWKAKPISPPPQVSLPPEPTDEFRPLAEDFHLTPSAMVPFQAVISIATSRDGSRVACTEYSGYGRIGQEQIHPNWSPRHPLWLCPRQLGTVRVFSGEGEELARAVLPEPGLFEARVSADGSLVWCVPMSWVARGLAGCSWLPADDQADQVFVYDLARQMNRREFLVSSGTMEKSSSCILPPDPLKPDQCLESTRAVRHTLR